MATCGVACAGAGAASNGSINFGEKGPYWGESKYQYDKSLYGYGLVPSGTANWLNAPSTFDTDINTAP